MMENKSNRVLRDIMTDYDRYNRTHETRDNKLKRIVPVITRTLFGTGILFIIFKLTGVIGWSWWWVTSPFIILVGSYILLVLMVGILTCILNSMLKIERKEK